MLMLGLEIYMGMRSSLITMVREVNGTALNVVSCTIKMNSLEVVSMFKIFLSWFQCQHVYVGSPSKICHKCGHVLRDTK